MSSLPIVVLDANVLIDAVAAGNAWVLGDPPSLAGVPSLPPQRVVNKLRDWAWPEHRIDQYLDVLFDLAELSGGGYNDNVPRTQHDCGDHEDNLILDLAVEVESDLIITNDADLLKLGPVWKGRPIVTPAEFAGRADGAAAAIPAVITGLWSLESAPPRPLARDHARDCAGCAGGRGRLGQWAKLDGGACRSGVGAFV